MLKEPEALDEFSIVISFSISTAETGKRIKLFACEGPRKSRGSISTWGISSANFLQISEKYLFKAEAIALESGIIIIIIIELGY